MAESLRDQLLKSGLAKKLKQDTKPTPKPSPIQSPPKPQHPPRRPPVPPKKDDVDLARAYALRAKVDREERERSHREAERVAREKKERKQKLTALLADKALNHADADVARHFPHGNKIRRIYCTPEQLARLNTGELAVVQLAGRYLLVERDVALQAQAIQPESLVLLCNPATQGDDDVPADLMW